MVKLPDAEVMPDNPSNSQALYVTTTNNLLLEAALNTVDRLQIWIKSVGHVREK